MPRDVLVMTLCIGLAATGVARGALAATAPADPAAAPASPAPASPAPAATPQPKTAPPEAAMPDTTKTETAKGQPAKPVTKMLAPDEAIAILGHDVDGPDGQNVGKLVDVLVDAGGVPRAAVLDVGGFLGVGNRIVSVDWDALHFHLSSKDHPIVTTLTPDQIRAAPEYKDPGQPAAVVVAPHHS